MLTLILGGLLLTGGLGLSLKYNWSMFKKNRTLAAQLDTCRKQAEFRLREYRRLEAAADKAAKLKRKIGDPRKEWPRYLRFKGKRLDDMTADEKKEMAKNYFKGGSEVMSFGHPPYTDEDREKLYEIVKDYLKAEKDAVRRGK